jgi:aminoglycoside 6'-N-acetyltransferase I
MRLRCQLWPHLQPAAHGIEMRHWLERMDTVVFVAQRDAGGLCGFAEVGSRSVADGCDTSPVAYLEGWYVDDDLRRQGVGRALMAAAEQWARDYGYREFASDVEVANVASQNAHAALGFTEISRAVTYVKRLGGLDLD